MKLPRITIVTPSFNQAAYLERTIDSVLSQGYGNLEYIVMDGGSTDQSVEIIRRYERHLSFWESRKDEGPGDAINCGFSRGTGEIMAYLNSDDMYDPGALDKAAAIFLRRPDVGVVYGDVRFVDAMDVATTFPGKKVTVYRAAPFSAGALFHDAMFVPQQASFWSRRAFELAGPMNKENWTCWDHEFFIRAALAGVRFARISAVLAAFRIHAQSISSENRWQDRRERDHARINALIANAGYRKTRVKGRLYQLGIRLIRAGRYLLPRT